MGNIGVWNIVLFLIDWGMPALVIGGIVVLVIGTQRQAAGEIARYQERPPQPLP